jgi:methionine-rich copper-binding protein CopC
MPRTRPLSRFAFIAILAPLLLTAVAAPPSDATRFHTRLLSSSPAKDTVLTVSPTAIELTFSEKVELSVSRIQLLGADKQATALAALTRDAKNSAATLVGRIKTPLPAGTYTVNWTAASADGHTIKNTYTFSVRPR